MADIYDSQTYQPRKGVGHLLNRVRTEILAAVDRELAADEQLGPLEVSSAQFIILATLGLGVTNSASGLCKGISYDAGAMTRMIDRLEDKGLLRRSRCPDDRRQVNLELTDAGMAAFPRMREISMNVLNRFLRGFTRIEVRQLEEFLARMLENAPGE
ncbi:MAG: MarR family winged helix-turn-helix transcriptional regulator [Steroidobacteraceae bacterium]